MRTELLALARKVAAALRAAIASKAAVDVGAQLRDVLPAPRLWPLAVILASWELSRAERNRGELSRLLRTAGVPPFWPQLDLFSAQLAPIFQAIRAEKSGADPVNSALAFLDAVQSIGMRTLQGVIRSQTFRSAAGVIARDFPESGENPKSKPPAVRVPDIADDEQMTAMSYLLYLGWDEGSVKRFMAGKG